MTDQPAEPYPPLEPVEFVCGECERELEVMPFLVTAEVVKVSTTDEHGATKTFEQMVGVCRLCVDRAKAREAKG